MSPRLFPPRPPDSASDPDAVPLAVPAVVIASIMLAGVLVAVVALPAWAHDYGAGLVYSAAVIYVGLAIRLLWWGVTVLRDRVADPEE
ncbi:hypothetical protein IU479_28330 [Nocardia abscessus]|uniref:hypothetical protein n=1 Tax=Nocardia TaxID=1817 RepID=UPI0018958DB4|nr:MULTISPECIES: hypothetical protein [Nocardia]MBF6222007.1 hypothetical protein [Nocardia abscessus]MDE1673288.1 hypothetical protein [Nocardia gipuzkoensis]